MNNVTLSGRLTADPTMRVSGETKAANYTLAVDRGGDRGADFIRCVAFGKGAEFADKYLKKGMKIIAEGKIRTGSYTKEDGTKIYTTDVVVNQHEFCEKKGEQTEQKPEEKPEEKPDIDGFINVPDGIDGDLSFMQ